MLSVNRPKSTAVQAARFARGFLALAIGAATPAAALEERPADWDANKACEQKVCTLILERKPVGDDMSCKLAKTWPKTTLQGGEGKLVKWGFGDARCEVDLNLPRSVLLKALTEPTYRLDIPRHQVNCVVESDGAMKPVEVALSPRIDFKNGKADKIWINLESATGPTSITATVKTAASLEDSLGIFHRSMIKAVNKFVHRQCDERYGPNAEAYARAKEERRAARRRARGEPDPVPVATPDVKPATTNEAAKTSPAETAATEPAKDAPKPPAVQLTPTPPLGERTSPAAAAKREAARASESKKAPTPAPPLRLELRTTTPWDVPPTPSKPK